VFFLVSSMVYLGRGTAVVAFGATARQQGLLYGDVTSGLPNDVIIDVQPNGSWTDCHFQVTSDVMGRDVTSG